TPVRRWRRCSAARWRCTRRWSRSRRRERPLAHGRMSMAPTLRRYGPALVLLAIPALLPVGRSAELPVLAAALAGIRLVWRDASLRTLPEFRLATALFLGYWLPQLAAAADALDRARAWQEVAADLRFLPLMWFALWALRPA